ncbi:MAG: hypothetical protein RLZZ238_1657 [Planctomycetota bacterium]
MRLYSTELDRTLLARAERARTERPSARRWRAARESVARVFDASAWRRLDPAEPDEGVLAEALLGTPAWPFAPVGRARIVHVIGSLAAGGAERQTVYTARETRARGAAEAEIVVLNPLEGAARHYLPLAEAGGVPVRVAGSAGDGAALARVSRDERLVRVLGSVDPSYRAWCVDLAGEFLARSPDLVHAWLDHANIWAGIAALACGVPRIVLSTRNVNPTHFPSLHGPYFHDWYRVLARSPRVRFIANSTAGADDYAAWIGVERARFSVVLNGFDADAMRVGGDEEHAVLRRTLGADGRPVVLGVFRLSEEKRPLDWLAAVRRVLEQVPEALVLLAGDGAMRAEVERMAADLGADRFRMLGVREDIGAIMSIATVVLHASRKEGTPNALLEAQAVGCPVVATAGGGTIDAVKDGETGFLCEVGDVERLAERAVAIIRDAAMRARMSEAARAFVRERFALARMVDETLAACGIGARA